MLIKFFIFITFFIIQGLFSNTLSISSPIINFETGKIEKTTLYQRISFDNLVILEDTENKNFITQSQLQSIKNKIETSRIIAVIYNFFNKSPEKYKIKLVFTERLGKNNISNEPFHEAFYSKKFNTIINDEIIFFHPSTVGSKKFYSLLAHELFHLLFQKSHALTPMWIEEGLAQIFEYIFFSEIKQDAAYSYFNFHTISLTSNFTKEHMLEKYGHAFLFFLYLYNNYSGPDLIKEIIKNEKLSLKRILEISSDMSSYKTTPSEILLNFSIAKTLNTTRLDYYKRYSLKPVWGKITPLEVLPKNFKPEPNSILYIAINEDTIDELQEIIRENPGFYVKIKQNKYRDPQISYVNKAIDIQDDLEEFFLLAYFLGPGFSSE